MTIKMGLLKNSDLLNGIKMGLWKNSDLLTGETFIKTAFVVDSHANKRQRYRDGVM